jgi:hypothetical protein
MTRRGQDAPNGSREEDIEDGARTPLHLDPPSRQWIGTVELLATLVVAIVIAAFVVWFLFFARGPLLH